MFDLGARKEPTIDEKRKKRKQTLGWREKERVGSPEFRSLECGLKKKARHLFKNRIEKGTAKKKVSVDPPSQRKDTTGKFSRLGRYLRGRPEVEGRSEGAWLFEEKRTGPNLRYLPEEGGPFFCQGTVRDGSRKACIAAAVNEHKSKLPAP